MLKAVFYARTSTEEEKQTRALDVQAEELRELITNTSEWKLVDEYIDQSTGTTVKGRDEFNRLLRDISSDKFNIIVIKDQDRLMRDEYTWYQFQNELISNNKRLFIKMESRFYAPESDSLITGIKAIIAAQYSRDLSRKLNQAHKSRMKKGTVVTNGRMWGYDQKEGKLIINETEAEVVRWVFNAYIAGKGFRSIVKELTDMGIMNLNGNPFALTTLKRMIRQEKYKGVLICGKRHRNFYTKSYDDVPKDQWIIHEDGVPAIVSKEIWEKANDILKSKVRKYGIDEKMKFAGYFNGGYPLSGKIKCGKCGRSYYHCSYSNKRIDGTVVRSTVWECAGYRSYGKNSKLGCDNPNLKDDHINDIARKVIFEFWQNKDENIKNVLKTLNQVFKDNESHGVKERLKTELQKVKAKKDKILELYMEELISKDEWKKRNEEIESRIISLGKKIEEEENYGNDIEIKKQRLYEIQNFLEQKIQSIESIDGELIKTLIKEITVKPDRSLEIVLNGSLDDNLHVVSASGQDRYTDSGGPLTIR